MNGTPLARKAPATPMLVKRLRGILQVKETSSFIMLLAAVLLFFLLSPRFLSLNNIAVILEALPEVGILAAGVTMLMISGEFDLSVGSVFAFCPVVMVSLADLGLNIWLAMFVSLALCCCIGAFNGLVTLKIKIPSFITTLGGMMLWRGIVLLITEGFPPEFPSEASTLRAVLVGQVGLIRLSLLYFVALVFILWVVLERTRFGNWTFATGGNPATARVLGIDPRAIKFRNFVLTSFLAGLSGLIQASRLRAVLPSAGQNYELDAIAAAVIGGTQLSGGVGSVIGGAIGALLIRIIDNGLVMAGAPGYWFRVFIAIVLILAVILNTTIREKAQRMRY
ncbi:MAG TPA: ABC transporter permease [Firmicutes bacterium]|nr:ABC transporter permease [Bacillota bacterium]